MDYAFGGSTVAMVNVLERAFLGQSSRRTELPFDTRFSARAAGDPAACGHVFIVTAGTVRTSTGLVVDAPVAFVLADDEFERVGEHSATLRVDGPATEFFQLQIPSTYLTAPVGLAHGPVAVPARVFAACGHDEPAFVRLVDELQRAGIVAALAPTIASEEPERFVRIWNEVRPLFASFAVSTPFNELADRMQLSLRQLARDAFDAVETYHLPAGGYRDIARLLRLRGAVLLLGALHATVGEVAERVGYASTVAMDRAFRDAGLPPPSAIRRALRG